MVISIGGFDGPRLAEVKSVSIHGNQGCGVYVLYLSLKVIAGNLTSDAFLSQLSCRLEVGKQPIKLANGEYEAAPVVRWTQYTEDTQLGFFFYLSSSQVNAIEQVRNSGDAPISVWLSGSVSYEGKSQSFLDKGDYVIPKQQWLQALAEMHYQDTLLFELLMPSGTDSNSSEVKSLLERAQSHILNGHYQEAIGLCRQAIEFVENYRDDKKQASQAVEKYKDRRKEMNVIERMLFLREGLKNITHLGNHNSEEFSRQQAQSVLGITVALLSSPEIGVIK
ncbi:MAG: hypothetical protein OEZ16_09645 [Chromatiales bacterium]|nr:hypothetical protein [Chromatiales bacterium]